MGAGSSSLVARSLRRSLRLCPSRLGTKAASGTSPRPPSPLRPLGSVVLPLENPPDVIEAHERYYSHGHGQDDRLQDSSVVRHSYLSTSNTHPRQPLASVPTDRWDRDHRDRFLPTQHQHPTPSPLTPCNSSSRIDAHRPHSHGRRHHHGHRARSSRTSRSARSLIRSPSKPPRSSRKPRHHAVPTATSRSCFGYNIEDVDGFLAMASLDSPANIPMVLACASVLYRTREGGWQEEVSLPLGMVLNGVFRASCWLYAQTPHGHEGYVQYASCLPLGILPQQQRTCVQPLSTSSRTSPRPRPACWDTASDIFPFPAVCSGNRTDTDKIKGTHSERAYAPTRAETGLDHRGRRGPGLQLELRGLGGLLEARRVERTVDALYLRASNASPSHSLEGYLSHDLGLGLGLDHRDEIGSCASSLREHGLCLV